MGPNVPRLRVDAEDGLEARSEAGQWWSMAGGEEVVVLQPVGQCSEVATVPARLKQLITQIQCVTLINNTIISVI